MYNKLSCSNIPFSIIYIAGEILNNQAKIMNNYEVVELIGEGAYGVVLKARRKDNGQRVAIKKFKETDDDELIKKTTMRQIKVLRSLKHKNIVQLQQAFKKKGLVHLVFQYLDNNLLEVLQKNSAGLPNKIISKCIYQVLEGLEYMHSSHYVHRDIKPQNLLINNEGTLKICDMGFAKQMQDQMTDYVATRWYRPPQLLIGARYGTAIDIWAVGCIMAELSDTHPLFPGIDQIDQLVQILSHLGQLPDCLKAYFKSNPLLQKINLPTFQHKQDIFIRYKSKLTDKGVDLLKKMLILDPTKRITASQALKHPYFDIIRPRKHRFQKTSQVWCSKNASKVNFTQNYTDRNSRNSEVGCLDLAKSLEKSNILKQNLGNVLFKFGQKQMGIDSKIENIKLLQLQKGMNKIYRKKQNEKSKYLIPYYLGDRKAEKLHSVMAHKTNINFKISQKKRQKSTYMLNV